MENYESLEAVHTHTHTHTDILKKYNGITLVALVVTIVVLLILSGVTINLVVGQNGLINRAKEAAKKTQEAAEGEQKEFDTATDYIKQTIGVTAAGITAEDYGKVVTNYNADGKTWEIFYADKENVYLITRESCGNQSLSVAVAENSGYNGTSDFDGSEEFKKKYPAVQAGWLNKTYTPSENGIGVINYSSSNENMKCTEYLLDSSVWNEKYLDSSKADWVIGGPTLELIKASTEKYTNNIFKEIQISFNGYEINDEYIFKKGSLYNHGYYYWLASPGGYDNNYIHFLGYLDEKIGSHNYEDTGNIRPVVCLNSSVTLILSEDGSSYSIK